MLLRVLVKKSGTSVVYWKTSISLSNLPHTDLQPTKKKGGHCKQSMPWLINTGHIIIGLILHIDVCVRVLLSDELWSEQANLRSVIAFIIILNPKGLTSSPILNEHHFHLDKRRTLITALRCLGIERGLWSIYNRMKTAATDLTGHAEIFF